MPVPIPEGDSAIAIMKWFVGLMVAAVTAMSGFVLFIINKFSNRESSVINENTASVENLAGVIEAQDVAISEVGEHLKMSNQLEHDRQILEADRLNRGR